MIETLLPAGIAACLAAGAVECRTLDALSAAVVGKDRIITVCTDARPCPLPLEPCLAISRVFWTDEEAGWARVAPGWSTWYACEKIPAAGS